MSLCHFDFECNNNSFCRDFNETIGICKEYVIGSSRGLGDPVLLQNTTTTVHTSDALPGKISVKKLLFLMFLSEFYGMSFL